MGVVFEWLLIISGIDLFEILRLAVTLFIFNGNMAVELFKAAQGIFFKGSLMFLGGNITKGNKNRIARMVVGLVKGFKLLVAQIGNIRRLSATVVVVGAGWIEVLGHGLPEGRINRTHGAFHLIEDHALIGQF